MDLKVLMKTICIQKGFLSQACYHKNSTETVQTSKADSFPAQKIVLGPVMAEGHVQPVGLYGPTALCQGMAPSQGAF